MDSSSTAVLPSTTVAAKRKKRQLRSTTEKLRIVEEALVPGASVALVAREHGVNANQVFAWRRLHQAGKLIGKRSSRAVTPAAAARLLPVTVSDVLPHPEKAAVEAVRTPARVLCSIPSGSIHIQFPKAQVRVEGTADASALRMVLEYLLR